MEGVDLTDMSRRESMHSVPSVHSIEAADATEQRVPDSLPGSTNDLHSSHRRLAESPTFKLATKYFAEPLNDKTVLHFSLPIQVALQYAILVCLYKPDQQQIR